MRNENGPSPLTDQVQPTERKKSEGEPARDGIQEERSPLTTGHAATPPWATGDDMPDPHLYVESELFVAGAISTLPPFTAFHPAWALPIARQALHALSEWEPSDG